MKLQWLSTATNRPDPSGWKLHAIEAGSKDTLADIRKRPAKCGLNPAHGWSIDLFLEKKCTRCLRATGLACPICKGRGDLGKAQNYKVCFDCNFTGEKANPSTASLEEMPETDFSMATPRKSPYAERMKK